MVTMWRNGMGGSYNLCFRLGLYGSEFLLLAMYPRNCNDNRNDNHTNDTSNFDRKLHHIHGDQPVGHSRNSPTRRGEYCRV